MDLKKYEHNPPHLNWSDQKYFITASTYNKIRYFYSDKLKESLLNSIRIAFQNRGWILEEWVILDNHYHILLQAPSSKFEIGNIIREIHKFSALKVKKSERYFKTVKQIWYNYWDKCLTFESSYFSRISYIWNNPVKHGYVEFPEDYKFSSLYGKDFNIDYFKKFLKNHPSDSCNIDDNFDN